MTEQPSAPSALYVVGDVHGHRTELAGALHNAGLTGEGGEWAGGDAQLWFLGDLVDRGPDGLGVLDLVMSLHSQADGQVELLLGNHEILLLGMHRWGETEISLSTGSASFARSWLRNGGQLGDLHGVEETHLAWLRERPLAAVVADRLLVHSDTLSYLAYGDTIEEITKTVHDVLNGDDAGAWWDIWRRLTTRFAFRGEDGPAHAATLLGALGGQRIVHGHSPVPDQLGILPEDAPVSFEYCEGLVTNVDSGLCQGGPVPLLRLS
ncbi:metallophosphoesterase [Longispora albida]|uniref:metallophosphoesterase n=1 Tax=Longispora albida TaxID=203523 RepID=UPI00039F4F2F|nr:metallophosphoesterase [Longispora albida]